MCRLYGFLSNEATKVDCSLVFAQNALMQQSRVDQSGKDHADGWGIVTYIDGFPSVQKKSTAAYDDQLFSSTAEKTYSTAIVAHIRKATVGKNSVNNTHPFVSGRWTFAHNGTLTGFAQLEPELVRETDPVLQQQRLGETDSEQYFFWLLTRLAENGCREFLDAGASVDSEQATATIEVLTQSVSQLAGRCRSVAPDKIERLNFVLTNGNTLIACRWNHSLYMIQRQGIYSCEICGIPHIHHHETVNHRAVAVASEPVTHEDWHEVENKNVVLINQQFHALV
jgi:glutamine amidotransferase